MELYTFSEKAELLLTNQSDEKVQVMYADNQTPFTLPKIGIRPPYYCHPQYEAYYPKL